jgi:hypothetical protein
VPGFNYFTALRNDRPLSFVHFYVPYDLIATANPSACDYDYWHVVDRAQVPVFYDLYWWLQAAKAQNLIPLITLTSGGATADNAGNPLNDNQNSVYPTWAQYFCGGYYLIQTVEGWAGSGNTPYVTQWEAYNEPDSPQPVGCKTCANVPPATAANYFLEALQAESYLGRSDAVAAGAFNYADAGGGTGYDAQYMAGISPASSAPVWSDHPYDDITSLAATNNVGSFQSNLTSHGFPVSQIWATEAADWLTDPHYPNTNGNPTAQDTASQVFAGTLGRASAVNEVYWYELAGAAGFDSGLLDSTGSPRNSYCRLVSPYLPGACTTSGGPGNPWSS